MELLKNLSKLLKLFFPFQDFVYLLQLEEYTSKRYARNLRRFFFRRIFQKRQALILTQRAQLTLLVSEVIFFIIIVSLFLMLGSSPLFLGALIFTLLIIPLLVLGANILIFPLAYFLRKHTLRRAKEHIRRYKNLTTITIAGSHGKSTTKAFLYGLLRYHYRTQTIAKNINTPLGIADWIRTSLKKDTEILLTEVDTYWPGEILDSCRILNPTHAILTSLGNQHLERFKNTEALHGALLEVFACTNEGLKIAPHSLREKMKNYDFNGITYTANKLQYKGIEVHTPQLSKTQKMDLALALLIAEHFDIPEHVVLDVCSKLSPPERRQKIVHENGFDIIDDSYNISL